MKDVKPSIAVSVEVLDAISDLEDQYAEECAQISEECVAEGYPSHGSNYEIRCESARKWYDEQIDELLEGCIADSGDGYCDEC